MLKYRLLERAWFSRKDAVGVGGGGVLLGIYSGLLLFPGWNSYHSAISVTFDFFCFIPRWWPIPLHKRISSVMQQSCWKWLYFSVVGIWIRYCQYCLAHGKWNVVAVCCTCTGLESSKILLNTFGVAKASKRLHVSLCICIYIYLSVCLFIYLVVASFLCGSCTGKIDEGGEGEWITNNVFTSGKGEYKNHARCNLI